MEGSEDTEERPVVHRGTWGWGRERALFFSDFLFFLLLSGAQAFQSQTSAVHGPFLISWPPTISAILSLPVCYLLPGLLSSPQGKEANGKGRRNGVVLSW